MADLSKLSLDQINAELAKIDGGGASRDISKLSAADIEKELASFGDKPSYWDQVKSNIPSSLASLPQKLSDMTPGMPHGYTPTKNPDGSWKLQNTPQDEWENLKGIGGGIADFIRHPIDTTKAAFAKDPMGTMLTAAQAGKGLVKGGAAFKNMIDPPLPEAPVAPTPAPKPPPATWTGAGTMPGATFATQEVTAAPSVKNSKLGQKLQKVVDKAPLVKKGKEYADWASAIKELLTGESPAVSESKVVPSTKGAASWKPPQAPGGTVKELTPFERALKSMGIE